MENRSFGGYSTRSLGGGGSQGFGGGVNSGPTRVHVQTVVPMQATPQTRTATPTVETKGFLNHQEVVESYMPAAREMLPDENPEKIAKAARLMAEQQIKNLDSQSKRYRLSAVGTPLSEDIRVKDICIRIKSESEIEISCRGELLVITNYKEMQMENTIKNEPSQDWRTLCMLADGVKIHPDAMVGVNRENISRLNKSLQKFFGREGKFISLGGDGIYHVEFKLSKDS